MKYIRTKNGIFRTTKNFVVDDIQRKYVAWHDFYEQILKQADTIKELCDWFLTIVNGRIHTYSVDFNYAKSHLFLFEKCESVEIKGAIWTKKGLIYVAKMKGILPNGEIDWELL